MKKTIKYLVLCFVFILITGCTNNSEASIVKRLDKKYSKLESYKLDGNLSVTNNDDVYNYSITVGYKKDNFYKVVLTNSSNDHTQIILKNNEGVYVVTP